MFDRLKLILESIAFDILTIIYRSILDWNSLYSTDHIQINKSLATSFVLSGTILWTKLAKKWNGSRIKMTKWTEIIKGVNFYKVFTIWVIMKHVDNTFAFISTIEQFGRVLINGRKEIVKHDSFRT